MDVKELRKKLGVSQEKMAQMVNVSIQTIHRWETGRAKPSRLAVEKMERIADGVTTNSAADVVRGLPALGKKAR